MKLIDAESVIAELEEKRDSCYAEMEKEKNNSDYFSGHIFDEYYNQGKAYNDCLEVFKSAANGKEELRTLQTDIGSIFNWILCKERLPEQSGYYLVTIESNINDEIIRTVEVRCFHKDVEFWAELTKPEFNIQESVIAWQPLLEAYREE